MPGDNNRLLHFLLSVSRATNQRNHFFLDECLSLDLFLFKLTLLFVSLCFISTVKNQQILNETNVKLDRISRLGSRLQLVNTIDPSCGLFMIRETMAHNTKLEFIFFLQIKNSLARIEPTEKYYCFLRSISESSFVSFKLENRKRLLNQDNICKNLFLLI